MATKKSITNNRYNKKTYDRLVLNVRKDSELSKGAIQDAAADRHMTPTAFILEAIREKIEKS